MKEKIMGRSTKSHCIAGSIAAIAATTFAPSAYADEPIVKDLVSDRSASEGAESRLTGHAGTSVQMNPTFISLTAGAKYRHVMSKDVLRERSYIQAGVGLTGSPSYVAPTVH